MSGNNFAAGSKKKTRIQVKIEAARDRRRSADWRIGLPTYVVATFPFAKCS
jgi:hypothetical protein